MGTNPTKAADNIYCRCRKEAAKYNDKLNSRDGAAELLGISASTLADYELGITKIIPADAILRMADLYNAPELRNHYCKANATIEVRDMANTNPNANRHLFLMLLSHLLPDVRMQTTSDRCSFLFSTSG